MECIKGKSIKTKRARSGRSKGLLEIIRIDKCVRFPTPTLSGQQYSIYFIEDFTRCGYII